MLINDIKEVSIHIPSNVISSFAMIRSFIASAERTYIIPVLGRKLYNELQKQYDNLPTDSWQELLEHVQYALVNFAVYKSLPKNNVTMFVGGAGVVSNSNMEVASQKRIEDLMKSLYEDAQQGIDQLLLFLEEDAMSDAPVFAELWKESKYYYQVQGSLINTAYVFNEYVNIDGSRARFVELKPHIAFSEKVYIRPELSNELIDYLIEHDSELDEAHTRLQSQLRNALAYYAADRDQLLRTDYYKTNAKLLLSDARNEVFGHPEKYPAFRNSHLYVPPGKDDSEDHWKNGKDKHLFVIGGTVQN